MAMEKNTAKDLEKLVLDSDTGARSLSGVKLKVTLTIALFWSLFQLWIASPLPFFLAEYFSFFKLLIIDGTKSRYIHLTFSLLLVYCNYPATKSSPKNKLPILDILLALTACFVTLYLLIFYEALSARSGMATKLDVSISIIGMLLLIEATRRALGPPLAIIASIFLIYTYIGPHMPEVLLHKGHNLTKIASHQWLSTEGVFGIALGVSTSFVFLFVLFGSLLEKAGAGNYFIKVAFSLLGHFKGGPAKAAVLSSAMTGLISGSSIANVVTTGTFTIPLMRKVGFSREKAGSIEVASSVNGQIMPPVMGAAAFLMVEYVGIPYIEVIKHAFIPAVISYIALLYIVHLEALKTNMPTLPRRQISTLKASILRFLIIVSSIIIIAGLSYYVFSFLKNIGNLGVVSIAFIVFVTYLFLIKVKSKVPELDDNPDHEMKELPEVAPTVKSGLHYLLPIAVLIWCLMVEKFSPGLSSFWATIAIILIIITQKLLVNYFRDLPSYKESLKQGLNDLYNGLVTGAKNMAAIGVATAAAGIIVGVVTQTGIGNKMTEIVGIISGDSVFLMLFFTAIICVILGMGLPTTANYIVVSSLMANVVVELGKQNGLTIPLIAVHFFVFYFGIMSDVTPPVGLASFAAAAVSRGNPLRTSVQAFLYSIRTMILPFLFIFDNSLLLIGVNSLLGAAVIFIKAVIGILIFSAAMQGYFIVKSKLKESLALLLVSACIFMPNIIMNRFVAPYQVFEPNKIYELVEGLAEGEELRLRVNGINFLGDEKRFYILTSFANLDSSEEKLSDYGLSLYQNNGKMLVSRVRFASKAEKDGLEMDFEITSISKSQEQPSNFIIYFFAFILFILICYTQKKRKKLKVAHV
jgi:TRAP-type uncharacterized transport system fused permease subunit